jgi:hypothetical protein
MRVVQEEEVEIMEQAVVGRARAMHAEARNRLLLRSGTLAGVLFVVRVPRLRRVPDEFGWFGTTS